MSNLPHKSCCLDAVASMAAMSDEANCNWLHQSRLSLRWRHNGCDSVSNHQPHHCLLNRLFRRRSKKTSKLRVTGLCAGTSPGTGEFSAQMASNAENVSIWWRHQAVILNRPLNNRYPNDQTTDIAVQNEREVSTHTPKVTTHSAVVTSSSLRQYRSY